MKLFSFLLILIILIAGCNINTPNDSADTDNLDKLIVPAGSDSLALNDTTVIAFADTLGNQTENIWISFDAIAADSRCPVNATCIWEGNAEVVLTLFDKATIDTQFTLNTNPTFTKEALISGYTVELVDLLPYPHTDSLFTADDHSAKFIISK